MRPTHPYALIDGSTGKTVCVYRALAIAWRDAEARNAKAGERRFYVERVTN
jgi:hypothetical protein